MISYNAFWRNVAVASLCASVAGCAPESVKNVEADKFGYLASEFSPGKLSQSIVADLAKLDQTPVPFQKMVLTVEPKVEYQMNANAKPDFRNTFTLINAGNGLVQSLDERFQNGLPTTQSYNLGYRNLLSLRSQQVVLSSTISNFVVETKSLSRVDITTPATASGNEFEVDGESGRPPQIANYASWKFICAWGAVHPAADLLPKFTGNARSIECRNLNRNGIQVSRNSGEYLLDYGIVLFSHVETANFKTDFKFVDAQIQ